ncbi:MULTISPECIES: very short patch repair endonuclease [Dietzia]|uniref:very short patch repair endonuclease n=1 Tax=Dietzia TaxID=37914 RepID=UPI00352D0214
MGRATRRPDIALIRWKVAVLVDGTFWHGHPDHWNEEKAASEYWREKMARNIKRDRAADIELTARRWTVVRICDFKVRNHLEDAVERVLRALPAAGRPG